MKAYLEFLLMVAQTDLDGMVFPWIEAELRWLGYGNERVSLNYRPANEYDTRMHNGKLSRRILGFGRVA